MASPDIHADVVVVDFVDMEISNRRRRRGRHMNGRSAEHTVRSSRANDRITRGNRGDYTCRAHRCDGGKVAGPRKSGAADGRTRDIERGRRERSVSTDGDRSARGCDRDARDHGGRRRLRVARAKARCRGHPDAGGIPLQRSTNRCAAALLREDVGGNLADRRTCGWGYDALIGDEVQHRTEHVHQRDGVRRAVLNAVRGVVHDEHAARTAARGQRADQDLFVVYGAIAAVVEHQRVRGDVRSGGPFDLDGLARIHADVVVVDFVDAQLGGSTGGEHQGDSGQQPAASSMGSMISIP